ncbi:MAG: glutamate-1-semialdehyde 2,1-aminomutase [Planctomycetes bacterium]|nr:glutamate-1-semialdehyde 2,1-aminomutase [Planctomycetota bacterium]
MENRNSFAAFAEACRYLPGGVNSPVRAFGGVDVQPVFIAGARGSKIFDLDGHEYIDYVGSWGPMILGHAHPAVLAAIHKATDQGTSFGAPTPAETALAARIVGAVPSIEKLRLVCSGTEAVMTAIRLARAATGRDGIIKMAGCYHGHSDSLLVQAGSGVAEAEDAAAAGPISTRVPTALTASPSVASCPGVPEALARLTLVVPYNDAGAVQAVLDKHAGQIAAVLVEPVAANMGVVPPEPGYLETLRRLCDQHGVLLIFDEVITGFRVAYGGAQELYGVRADLTCLGKIAGGGLPLAVCGGRAAIMDLLAPLGRVYQAGTLSGNPLATAAAIATLDILAEGRVYRELESSAANLAAGLAEAAADAGVRLTINRVGSLLSGFFTGRPVRNFDDVRSTDVPAFKRFFAEMLRRGIYVAPSAYEAMFVSLAHTKQDIDRTLSAARASFRLVMTP